MKEQRIYELLDSLDPYKKTKKDFIMNMNKPLYSAWRMGYSDALKDLEELIRKEGRSIEAPNKEI